MTALSNFHFKDLKTASGVSGVKLHRDGGWPQVPAQLFTWKRPVENHCGDWGTAPA